MNRKDIVDAIENALEAEEFGSSEIRHDIAFHMTDWLADLDEWNAFCQSPESVDPPEIMQLLIRFLVHVPNHIAAASKLLTDIPVSDVFEVGATADNE